MPKKTARKRPVLENNPEFRLRTAERQPVQVKHHDSPPPFERRERIHPRRVLRLVLEGEERQFHSSTQELSLAPPDMRASTDDIVLVTNTELTGPARQQLASNVGEPSAAINGKVVMYTGNWYAAQSADGGQTFQYLDPFRAFPDPPNMGFCCDQVVNYIASIDTFVWLLQYGPKTGPDADNLQRLAFAKTADVIAGRWRLFDISARAIGVPGMFLDFPDLAVGANSLYITTNIFRPEGTSLGAAVIRIPVDGIASGKPVAKPFVSRTLDSFRVAQNCGKTAYFAAHQDTSTLAVFAWDESKAAPVQKPVGVARWIGGNGFRSVLPDGKTWLDRADPRITGATLAGNQLYFAWGVNSNSNHRPRPFVQIARIDAKNLTLLENINVFDPNNATCYGALSSNANNEVAISYMIGGAARFPSHAVSILTGTRKDLLVKAGERGPLPNSSNRGEWGDYLTVRPVYPDRKLFAATGYTMQGAGDGSNRDSTPRFVIFGRKSDAAGAPPIPVPGPSPNPGTPTPQPPVPPGPLPPTPVADGDPIRDVNTLPVVPPDVATKIKAAVGLVSMDQPEPKFAEFSLQAPPQVDTPGVERWPVKTGQDPDRAKVGKNVVNGVSLGAGIVEATLEELVRIPRPAGMEDPKVDPPQFNAKRNGITELTIWRIDVTITGLKHEKDGDYHLVLQGDTTATMVGEIPTPTSVFVGDSPWLDNIKAARAEIDDKLIQHLSPASFSLVGDKLMPAAALRYDPRPTAPPGLSFVTPPEGSTAVQPLFDVAITPRRVRLTGIGFFDRWHNQKGVAANVIELHPVLKVEWL